MNLQQTVDGLGLEPGRLGHAFRSAAGRGAQQKSGALGREDAQDGLDDGRFANAAEVGVCAIVAKPANFDHQTVTLQGTATALKETTSHRASACIGRLHVDRSDLPGCLLLGEAS